MEPELEAAATKETDAFGKIWSAFGPVLKEGLYEDHERRHAPQAELLHRAGQEVEEGVPEGVSRLLGQPEALHLYALQRRPDT